VLADNGLTAVDAVIVARQITVVARFKFYVPQARQRELLLNV
jgi:hypothetical protein